MASVESATSAKIRVRSFRTKYCPPGCVIEGAEFRSKNGPGAAPLMTIGRLTILSNYRQLLSRQRIEVMHLEDVRLDMGQRKGLKLGGGSGRKSGSNSPSVTEIVIDRGVIEYPDRKSTR